MSAPHPSPDERVPDTLARVLDQLGAELDAALDVHAGPSQGAATDRARVVQHRLEAAVARAAPLSAADARRVEALRRRLALVSRVDRGADIVADVTARLPQPGTAEWRRAVLGEAFLEAPASLARWRRAAMAAAVLAAVGVTLSRTADERSASRGPRGPDPRVGLLEPLEPVAGAVQAGWSLGDGAGTSTRNVGWQVTGVPGGVWQQVPRTNVDPWRGRAVRVLPLRIRSTRGYERVVDPFFGAPRPSDEVQAPVERN
ncbi:MAG: hypothetical protein H6806_08450 [Planctomycetes bacterium]|nr:hypothetical protein [Planctomycetota bacterium]MCB9829776.1 hypothetical protein [Planctomycetota bacterium]